MKVHIVTVGDEILIGQTIDTNSAWMGQQLNSIGAEVVEITTVADEYDSILNGIKKGFENADIVLMTGGLGPTKDDITKKTIADFFQVGMSFHEETFARLTKAFAKFGIQVQEAHRIQCQMPNNAQIIKNNMGTAPGMWFENEGKVLVSMPGVPYEMKWLMQNGVISGLKEKFKSQPIVHRTIMTAGTGESRLAKKIEDIEEGLPAHIKVAYLPSLGTVRLRLTARGDDEVQLNEELDQLKTQVIERVSNYVYGFDEETLEQVVGKILKEKELKLSLAESCTGGYIAHRITSVPGSSAYFWGSVVSYANEIKMNTLGVKEATLIAHGAVSEQTVKEMVAGAISTLNTDVAIATSGIMGPGGGTDEKPVGTIWVAVGNKDDIRTHKLTLTKSRSKNIEYTGNFALNFLRKFLLE